ncbi:MAG: hypothetical protein A2Y38_25815 [Spirochaetes bacterium GWB1_59_5]|nr:MAG: hypothetical protein A2Y38_25815 [Spirochaetes bacterium GWB1_59_5]
MATETNATWFDGALSEYVQGASEKREGIDWSTPFTDSLPRTSAGIAQGWWFDETVGRPQFVWGRG